MRQSLSPFPPERPPADPASVAYPTQPFGPVRVTACGEPAKSIKTTAPPDSNHPLGTPTMHSASTQILLTTLLLLPTSALAKPPTLDRLFPPGAQRGQTIEVSAEGNFDPWPLHAWVLGSGVQVHPADDKGKLSISVSPDAPSGLVWLRLYNNEGASALKPFLIGTLPEIAEAEPNDEPSGAQPIDPPSATINGRLAKSGDVDGYALSLLAGQTLIASVQANHLLGSPMDAVLQVATPDGLVVAQEDDSGGLDPRLVFVAPENGTYIVRTFAFPPPPTPPSGSPEVPTTSTASPSPPAPSPTTPCPSPCRSTTPAGSASSAGTSPTTPASFP